MTTDLRVPPQDLPAEEIVLGSMLVDAQAVPLVRSILKASDFYMPRHRLIFVAIGELTDTGQPNDAAAVLMRLRDKGELEKAGGQDAVETILNGVPSIAQAEHYARRVHARAVARQAIGKLSAGVEELYRLDVDPETVLAQLQGDVYGLLGAGTSDGPCHFGQAAADFGAELERRYQENLPPGILTGLDAFDEAMGGFQEDDLTVLAADTSAGKTALALNIADNIASRPGAGPVLYVSREMGRGSLAKRLIQARSNVSGQRIRFVKSLAPADWTAIQGAIGELQTTRGYIDDFSTTISDVAARAQALSCRCGEKLSLIVLDYLGNFDIWAEAPRGCSLPHAVGQFAWRAKQLASRIKTPVLLLSQLSREGNKKPGPPSKHDLKESGDLENHANNVLLLYRPPTAAPDPTGAVEVWGQIAKCRDGMTTPWQGPGAIRLRWLASTTKFSASWSEQ